MEFVPDTTGKADVSNENTDAQDGKEDDRGTKGDSEPPPSEAKKSTMEPEAVIDLASEDKEKEPRALHKTSSIFLRNLAPTITKAEVEAVSRCNCIYVVFTSVCWLYTSLDKCMNI